MTRFNDITGKRFGRLTVLRRSKNDYISPSGVRTTRWVCQCNCGSIIEVLRPSLINGSTRSCGCLQREKAMTVAEDLTGQRFGKLVVVGRIQTKKYANGISHGWKCKCDCGNVTICQSKSLKSGEIKSCGCLLKDTAVKKVKNVLTFYDGTQVCKLLKKEANKSNQTGIRGVYWSNRDNCYIACIGIRNKKITLCRTKDLQKAVTARKKAEEEYYKPIIEEYEKNRGTSD